MVAKEEISKLRDDFIALHTKYKSLCAEETNPSVGTPPRDQNQYHHEATRKKLSSLVDKMLDIMFHMFVISTNEIERQSRKIASLQQDHSYSLGVKKQPAAGRTVPDEEEEGGEEDEEEVEREKKSVEREEMTEEEEQDEEDCQRQETPKSGKPKNSIESLLIPEVCLNEENSSFSKDQTSIDDGTIPSDSNNRKNPEATTSDKDASNQNQQSPKPEIFNIRRKVLIIKVQRSNPLVAGRSAPPYRGFVGRPGATRYFAQQQRFAVGGLKPSAKPLPDKSNRIKFNELTQRWLDTNRPPPPPLGEYLNLFKLKPEHKQEAYAFHNQYKDLFDRKLIIARIMEKYYLSNEKASRVIRHGDKGRAFKPGCSGGCQSSIEKDPEKVKEILAYCKANPFNFTCLELGKKYGVRGDAVSHFLKKHGVKVYTPAERRAMRLNMQGKEYKPYFNTPELIKYRKTQLSELKKRRQEGDMRDGRSARHKDPNWKTIKEVAGVPKGLIVYDKEYHKEWEAKRALRSLCDPEVDKPKAVRAQRKRDSDDEDQTYRVEVVPKRKQTSTSNHSTSVTTPTRMTTRSTRRMKKSTARDTADDQSSQSAAFDLDTVASDKPTTSTTIQVNHISGHSSTVWPVCDSYTGSAAAVGHTHGTRSSNVPSAPQSQAVTPHQQQNLQTQPDYFLQYFQSFNTFEEMS